MRTFIHPVAAFLLLSACSATRPAIRQEMATRPEPSSVLFIGNSYSFEVPEQFRRVAAREGKKLRIRQITNGGWTLAQHVASGEAAREIRNGKWDIVVIQEQSRIPSLPTKRVREMIPNVIKLAEEARAAGAVPVLYQTWGRRDGDTFLISGDDFHSMNKRLRDGYHQAAKAAGGLTVVPVGDAWEREVDAGRGGSLFMPDGSHPTTRAEELTAEVFFKTIFLTEKAHQPLQDGQ